MPPHPEISVLMNVRNGMRYIDAAVSSILTQTFHDLELIAVNDGSDDGTGEWLDQKSTTDSRLKVIHIKPSGIPVALNAGLEIARGRYIAKMDADDIALPHRLEKQLAVFQADPDLVLLGSEVEMIDEQGMHLGTRGHPTGHADIRQSLLLGNGGTLTHPAVMFRTDAANSIGGYDPRFPVGQDLDLFLRLTDIGKAENLSEVLLHWRQHPRSINRTRYQQWQDLRRRAVRLTIERIGPSRYAEELFPEASRSPFATTRKSLAKRALKRHRLNTAAAYARQMLQTPDERIEGAKILSRTAFKWLASKMKLSR